MKTNGNMYRGTSFRDCGRRAGTGISEDNYGDESGPGKRKYEEWKPVRLPHDGEKPENLNGPCIIVQAGKEKEPKLKVKSYEEARMKYFREQLRLANNRLDYAVRNHYPETVCADRGDAVRFYSDIIKILEGKNND